MKTEDVLKEVKEIEEETQDEPRKNKVFYYIIGIGLIAMIILMIVPFYSIKTDPSPKIIPTIKEVVPTNWDYGNETKEIGMNTRNNYLKLTNPSDPEIKRIATNIVTQSCEEPGVCYAKALYYFVRDNLKYVKDPQNKEYLESPFESLKNGGMDCDGHAILLATLQESIGYETEFVFIYSHVYIRSKIPEALIRYKREGWVYMDPTCKKCEFGEIPVTNIGKREDYLKIP